MENCGSGRAKQWRMVMIALSLKFVMVRFGRSQRFEYIFPFFFGWDIRAAK